MQELVSIIVALYNSSELIFNTFDRLINQTYQNIEIILVDDGSKDNTFEIVSNFEKKFSNVFSYRKENSGVAATRNFGIKKANGKYIAFCDHDDLWKLDKLEKQMKLFKVNNDVAIVYSYVKLINKNGIVLVQQNPVNAYQGDVLDKIVIDNFIPFSSAIVKKNCLDEIGVFHESREMHGSDDRNLWMRISTKYKVRCYKEALVDIVVHGNNYSLNEEKMLNSGLICLDNFWTRYPKLKKANKSLFKRSYAELYWQFGKTFFFKNNFKMSRKCMMNTVQFRSLYIKAYIYILFSIMPISVVNFIREVRIKVNKKGVWGALIKKNFIAFQSKFKKNIDKILKYII